MSLPVPTSANKVAIIALSARPYVQLAKSAGWQVVAVDAFGDKDTQECADTVIASPDLFDSKLQPSDIKQHLDALLQRLSQLGVTHIAYGAGFEHAPSYLEMLASNALGLEVLGNTATTLKSVKDPQQLQQACAHLGLRSPSTLILAPTLYQQREKDWLVKQIGACGGTHIQPFKPNHQHREDDYYQAFQVGLSIGALFVSDGVDAYLIGVHQQWQKSDSYIYAGASVIDDVAIKSAMQVAVKSLAAHFGLVGINSLDAIWHDGELYILEINPRLSASVSLYASDDLFDAHIATCKGQTVASLSALSTIAERKEKCAYAVIFAKQALHLPAIDYPDWVADVPDCLDIEADAPICSVYADVVHEQDLIKQLKIHIQILKQLWGPHVSQHIETSFD
jgi:uncharacterized protein